MLYTSPNDGSFSLYVPVSVADGVASYSLAAEPSSESPNRRFVPSGITFVPARKGQSRQIDSKEKRIYLLASTWFDCSDQQERVKEKRLKR